MKRFEECALAPTRVRQRMTACVTNKTWTPEEDFQLIRLVQSSFGAPNWAHISKSFPGKSETQVAERWTKVLDPSLLKGSWTRHEDEVIVSYVTENGTKSWAKLSELLPGRIGKQCRERWVNALDPSLDRGPWTPEEDQMMCELHRRFGNHWTKIAAAIPNRSDNAVKNRWHSTLSRRKRTAASPPLFEHPKAQLPSIELLPMPSFPLARFEDGYEINFGRHISQPAPGIREGRTALMGGDPRLTDIALRQCSA